MPTEPLADRERQALASLRHLVARRAEAEGAVAGDLAARTAEAERDVARQRKALAAARKREIEELQAAHKAQVAKLVADAEARLTQAAEDRQAARTKTVNHFSAALQKLRAEYEDKLWTQDSLKEAGEKEANDAFEEAKRKASASGKRLESLWTDVAPTLGRAGLTREAVRFDAGRLPSPTVTDPVGKLQKSLEDVDAATQRLASAPLMRLLGLPGVLAIAALAFGIGAALGFGLFAPPESFIVLAGVGVVGTALGWLAARYFARLQVQARGQALGVFHAEAERSLATLRAHAGVIHAATLGQIAEKYAAGRKDVVGAYEPRIAETQKQLDATLAQIEAKLASLTEKVEAAKRQGLAQEHARHQAEMARVTGQNDDDLAKAEADALARREQAKADAESRFNAAAADYRGGIGAVHATCRDLIAEGASHFRPWDQLANQPLATAVPGGMRLGSVEVDQAAIPHGVSTDPRLADVAPVKETVPAFMPFPRAAALLVKAHDEGRAKAVATLQTAMLRFLTSLPPGKVRFTIIDPVGLGENFASFMHLADADENLVTSRIWTEPGHIATRLSDLTEHMENVIQKYLRNQYASIEDYNQAAGEVAEPYRVLVVANFPHNFTTESARRLVSILASGPACGVCSLISVDERATLPRDFRLADLEQAAFVVKIHDGVAAFADPELAHYPLTLDAPPAPDRVAAAVRRVGQASLEAGRVEVPFEFIMPPNGEVWTKSAAKGFEVPIGRAGATRRQMMTFGRGTSQHALVAGKTGSGKSTLLHALITNLALHYSPDEAELYLIDFKKGVEFQAYAEAKLPHARVIAIESEREFGLSVLQRLDGILRERGDRFREAGVNDLAGYREHLKKQAGDGEPKACPRVLLIVDEFQEFFVEDDKLAQEAALLMDRLVRQGRAFGVHVLLGSQTLGGAYSLARSTIDQMAVRVALQCSEADAQLILSKDNTAARLLNRPGEAIYNDANGLVEGNDPFQVVWLSDERRAELLADIRRHAAGRDDPPALVFAGSTHADLALSPAIAPAAGPATTYLGDPVAIKAPTAAAFRAQSGANLLLLGQQEESALALFAAALVSLRSHPLTVLDGTPDDSDFADYLRTAAVGLGLSDAVADRAGLTSALAELAAELDRRQKGESERTPRFLLVHGLHRLRELRKVEDDFGYGRKGDKPATPAEHFATILREGPPLGIHVITWCDSLTNLQRVVDRQGLREFTLRVLFQMSPADSSQMIDSPVASRLGRHRALYLEEGAERMEKFRPYGLPSLKWLREFGEQLPPAPAAPAADPAGVPAG